MDWLSGLELRERERRAQQHNGEEKSRSHPATRKVFEEGREKKDEYPKSGREAPTSTRSELKKKADSSFYEQEAERSHRR